MKNYLKFYGVFYILILAIIVTLGYTYTSNINKITENKVAPPIYMKDTATQPEDLPYIKGSVTGPIDVNKFAVSTPELIEKGKSVFNTQCASCHGAEGKGDGIAGANLNPKPRNFHSLEGWTNGPEFNMMYKTLQEGIVNRGMASYSNLPPDERFALIHFIRTLAKYPEIKPDELIELDKTYSLSAGLKTPNQIPVKAAIEILISENDTSKKIKTTQK